MTTNKTTALIARVIHGSPLHGMPLEDCETMALQVAEAIAAFEQPAVRELSVDEVAKLLDKAYNEHVDYLGDSAMERYCNDAIMCFAVRSLAKLGTIRVVEEL